jgi:hypothetical protein
LTSWVQGKVIQEAKQNAIEAYMGVEVKQATYTSVLHKDRQQLQFEG